MELFDLRLGVLLRRKAAVVLSAKRRLPQAQPGVIFVTDAPAPFMYKRAQKGGKRIRDMLDEATESKSARRGGLQTSAKSFRRTAPNGRTNPRASLVTPPSAPPQVFWHGELPPLDAEPVSEHTIEATSARVPHTLEYQDELWHVSYDDLMAQAGKRLEQEIARLGGDYAHVLDEHVESKYSGASSESWLAGRFRYMLYRKPAPK